MGGKSILDALVPQDSGNIRRYDPDAKSEAERQKAAEIIGGVFTYERVNYDSRHMNFLPDGTVGVGEGGRERFWNIRQEDARFLFEIASETEVTCCLTETAAGEWRGRW